MTDREQGTTPFEQVMRCYANNPAASGFVPVSPATLLRWAAEMERLRVVIRVNGLRAGATDVEIDEVIYGKV